MQIVTVPSDVHFMSSNKNVTFLTPKRLIFGKDCTRLSKHIPDCLLTLFLESISSIHCLGRFPRRRLPRSVFSYISVFTSPRNHGTESQKNFLNSARTSFNEMQGLLDGRDREEESYKSGKGEGGWETRGDATQQKAQKTIHLSAR